MKMYLPAGISNYKKLRIEDYYTVDTLCAQKRDTDDSGVSRAEKCGYIDYETPSFWDTARVRFSETLNMSRHCPPFGVMAEFFDITKDSKALFKGLAIMDTEYAKEMPHGRTASISILWYFYLLRMQKETQRIQLSSLSK